MPLILEENDFPRWLDQDAKEETVAAMLRPYCAEEMEAFPVSQLVNNARNETAQCVEPVPERSLGFWT